MSQIVGGGANLFIANGQTQNWIVTWHSSGWQGNTVIEAQPLNTGAELAYTEGSASLNSNGTFSFSVSIKDRGPNNTFYNLQVSSN